MADYKLHCMGESGNSYKAALPLQLSGLDWETIWVDFFHGQTRTPEFRENLSVMGEVPILETGDLTLTQSGVIQHYITDQTGMFGGENDAEKYEILRWCFWDNHKMSSMAGLTRFLMNFLPEDKRPADIIAFNQGRLKAAYQTLDAALEGKDWLVGNGPTNADFSCCGYLYYPEPFDFDRKGWANIDRWLDGISALPGWKHPYDLMPRSAS